LTYKILNYSLTRRPAANKDCDANQGLLFHSVVIGYIRYITNEINTNVFCAIVSSPKDRSFKS